VFGVFLLGILLPALLPAEAPEWASLKAGVFLTSRQAADFSVEDDNNQGIWRLDPLTGSFDRIRQFSTTRDFEMVFFFGDDGRLASVGDRLIYETWPADFRFDAFSWRMLNRVPAPNPEGSLGWALQGPILGLEDLGSTGLRPGKYGFAQCILDDVSNVHLWGPRSCDPLELPEGFGNISISDNQSLFFSGEDPSLMDTMSYETLFVRMGMNESHTLSFDEEDGGFWRGDDEGISFFPVADGNFGAESFRLALDFEPFSSDHGYLAAAHWHSASKRLLLFGLLFHWDYSAVDERHLFSVDPLSGDRLEIEMPRGSGEFPLDFSVVSMASFRSMPKRYEQMLPIIARTPGINGTFWSTDLWLFNPSDEAMEVHLSRISRPENVLSLQLGPHQSLHQEDVLGWMGGGASGDGVAHDALLISSDYRWAEQLAAYGRIWTPDPESGGSFGEGIPAIPYPLGYSNHGIFLREDPNLYHVNTPGLATAHFDLDLRQAGRYRYNLGFVNSTDEEIEIEILWGYNDAMWDTYGLHHPEGWRKSVRIPAHSVKVLAVDELFPEESRPNWPPRLGVLGPKPLPVFMSMVDQKTGDATFVPYSNFNYDSRYSDWEGGSFYRLALPVVARTKGRHGSQWQTDLFGYTESDRSADTPSPYFYPADPETRCGGGHSGSGLYARFIEGEMGMGVDAWLDEILNSGLFGGVFGWRTIFPDIVHYFPECDEDENVFGAVELMTGSWFSGFSRTYTTRPDGGTYGSMLPLYPPHGWPVQHFAGIEVGEETRVNVGFYNGDHEHAITHRVRLYSADGEVFAETQFVLGSTASRLVSLEALFGRSIPAGSYGMTVLPLDGVEDDGTPFQGHSWCYVSVIDNTTNDPINLW